MPIQTPEGKKVRSQEEVKGVPRSGALSLWRTAKEETAVEAAPKTRAAPPARAPEKPRMRDRVAFLGKSFLKWAEKFISTLFARTRKYRTYAPPATGIYTMPDVVTIALASDWGTGTTSAYAVGNAIRELQPHITIHLGDVYYSGTRKEYEDYFLPLDCWPRGSLTATANGGARGTYLLNANHEMYSGGEGYFDAALPAVEQDASYFCLQNTHWRVIGLDTGYHVTRGLMIAFKNDTKLHKSTVEWLEKNVFADPNDTRSIILLSHHQWFSAFDKREYPRVGKELAKYLDRVVLWFWGHEHRLAGYAPFGFDGKKVRARCIGHGGMPVEVPSKIRRSDRPVVFHDDRQADVVGGEPVGFCGFAVMRLDGPRCEVQYIDETKTLLLTETWVRQNGRLTGSVVPGPGAASLRWLCPESDLVR